MSQIGTISSGSGPLPPTVPTSFTGDIGVAIPIANNLNVIAGLSTNNSGSTVFITASGGTLTFNVTSLAGANTIIGNLAGNATMTGTSNTGLGSLALSALTTGTGNTAIGSNAMLSAQDLSTCVAIGNNALANEISGLAGNSFITAVGYEAMVNAVGNGYITALGNAAASNIQSSAFTVSIGNNSLLSATSASNTVAIGFQALRNIQNASFNIAIGHGSGILYNGSETQNIILGTASGVIGETNVMRLGHDGGGGAFTTATYVAGVSGVTVANAQPVYMDTTTGQMGTNPGSWTAWTPTIVGETTAGTTTYGIQDGRYIQMGNTIIAQFSMGVATATGTGNVLISNLPFPLSASATQNALGPLSVGGLTWPAGTTQVTAFAAPSTTFARVLCSGSATTATFMQMANIAFTINGTITYEI